MTLDARVVAHRGGFAVDAPLAAGDGSVVAVLGPNGAGKTTLLHALAGLLRLEGGHVRVDGVVWADADAGRHLAPAERAVGMLAADHLLFPHLSARANVAFGPRSRGATRRTAAERADRELDALGVLDLADRRPADFSHGQAQRVALARALATDPRLLLLDEPLSALDPATRPQVRAGLAARLRDFTGVTVVVTHDPLDALTLADHLVFVEDGTVVQEGSPVDVVARPRDPYVAGVVGLNLYPGTADDGSVVSTPLGAVVTAGYEHRGDSWVSFAPSAVALYPEEPHGSTRNVWRARVASVELLGQHARVRLVAGPTNETVLAEVTTGSVATLRLHPGTELWAGVKATEVTAYPS